MQRIRMMKKILGEAREYPEKIFKSSGAEF